MTQTTIESIEALDFDPQIPCEHKRVECPNPGEWFFRRTCCNYTCIVCDEHKRRWEERTAAFFTSHFCATCAKCGAVAGTTPWVYVHL